VSKRRSSTLLYLGGALVGGGVLFAGYNYAYADIHTLKDNKPDDPQPAPGKTGYKLIDRLMPKLTEIAKSTGIPLGLLIGWIAKESGGKLGDVTKLNERGYFQLMPSESKRIGVDHDRLSTDSDYSLDAGTKLIREYERSVKALNVPAAPVGSAFYWRLVKLAHTVGEGQTKKFVKAARAADKLGSWQDFENYCLTLTVTGPQPKKWFPFLDSIYDIGKRFGFGTGDTGLLVSGLYGTSRRPSPPSPLLGLDVFAAG
jgi:hypothetical protein